ncbi:MAG: tRNA (guanosine(46)-N7)-methyltransferase TrmB [Clostridiales bacterium]|nr:tRNA (guanosine(46)-N7)-methyltransferase TrmB [Clostridiales bacterium]MDY4171437.1 tRNA (guanosine(46)-N7)-methyltransferase TrmB [Evtepia sp.]
MRMRRKKNLVPRMENCAQWLIRDPQALRGNWRSLMPTAKELRLELGCGKGRFTCQTAASEPEVLFVAVERVPDAMVMAMERARDMGLTNVFFVDADAANLPDFFAPEEVDLIYINFCDPWPPKRHAKRRLTHRNFLLLYRQVLKEKGEIHFKTDNVGLFAFSVTEFPFGGFQPQQVTHDLHKDGVQGIMTDYEEKFHNLGTKINRCVAVKGELPPQQETSEPQQNSAQAE